MASTNSYVIHLLYHHDVCPNKTGHGTHWLRPIKLLKATTVHTSTGSNLYTSSIKGNRKFNQCCRMSPTQWGLPPTRYPCSQSSQSIQACSALMDCCFVFFLQCNMTDCEAICQNGDVCVLLLS